MSVRFSLAGLALMAAPLFAQSAGTIKTVAGSGSPGFSGDGGPAKNADLGGGSAGAKLTIAPDGKGDFYIGDLQNNRVRMVNTQGIINTVAGGGAAVPNGVKATQADIAPGSVALDNGGNLIIASGAQVIKVDTQGIATIVAGSLTNPESTRATVGPPPRPGSWRWMRPWIRQEISTSRIA